MTPTKPPHQKRNQNDENGKTPKRTNNQTTNPRRDTKKNIIENQRDVHIFPLPLTAVFLSTIFFSSIPLFFTTLHISNDYRLHPLSIIIIHSSISEYKDHVPFYYDYTIQYYPLLPYYRNNPIIGDDDQPFGIFGAEGEGRIIHR